MKLHKSSIKGTLNHQKETIASQKETIASQKETIASQKETIASQKETIANQNSIRDELIDVNSIGDGLIHVLVNSIEMKDPYTAGHSKGVADLCLSFAKCKLNNLIKNKEKILYYSSIVHDIGKIGVLDYVLNKPSKLTFAEQYMIRSHCEMGYKLLNNGFTPKEMLDAVLYHHEDYDGGGYPKNLKGDKIPFISRVLKIVDVFDALTTDRAYRLKYSPKDALIIMKNNDHVYDPNIFSLFEEYCAEYLLEEKKIFKIKISELTENMVFAEDVIAENGRTLLTAGHNADNTTIHRLKKFDELYGVIEPLKVFKLN